MGLPNPFSSQFGPLSSLFNLGFGQVFGTRRDDTLVVEHPVTYLDAGRGDDDVTLESFALKVDLGRGDDTLLVEEAILKLDAGRGDDDVTLNGPAGHVDLGNGDDTLLADGFVLKLDAGKGDDTVTLNGGAGVVNLDRGNDNLTASDFIFQIDAGRGNDNITTTDGAGVVDLGRGNDSFTASGYVAELIADRGNDDVTLEGGGGSIDMGRGRDTLTLSELVEDADGGRGNNDELIFTFDAGALDIAVDGDEIIFSDRFSGQEMTAEGFETITFADRTFSIEELEDAFGADAVPFIQVAGGTQAVTVNNIDPTVSVLWDRVVQQAVIDTDTPVGPTIASRAYAMMHTAMYDAWSAYDDTATHVSLDLEGDNVETTGSDADKEKAMSYAAITVLRNLFPDQEELYAEVMQERLGFDLEDDGSLEAQIGIDAAEDLLALRSVDGSNQANGYVDTTGYTPVNPNPNEINDITAWTPENVPIDPEDDDVEQTFLTPQWLEVEGFGLAENADGSTDFSNTLPPEPQPFFTEEFADATLNFDDKTITLGSDATIDGMDFSAGDTIDVSKDLIGTVINEGFITQAEEVIDISADLVDREKIIAEFWEDGGGTAFPPGTFMSFAQFASARDGNSIDEDAQLFMIMGNAVMDAGIATWQAKVEYDYVRPVRAIRDLGELGLIGEEGIDENTGEEGFVITAFGGFNEDGTGRGTQTILAENWVTFQLPNGNPSPPFAEYTSGHSAFSASGAEVLRLFTGSDDFGGSVTFAPGSTIFEQGVPAEETTLAWDTFSVAADEAGLSRLFGGIHFNEGDIFGRELGRQAGSDAFDLAQSFFDGTATDADRPFGLDDILVG